MKAEQRAERVAGRAATRDPGDELPINGTELQRHLAAAAIELFYRQGARATTVREITHACGLTPGALYNHFVSKDELLYTVVRDIHLRFEHVITEAQWAAAPDPAAQLAAIVRAHVAERARHRQRSHVANREYTMLTGQQRKEVVAIRRRIRNRLAGVILTGCQQGGFDLVGAGDQASAILTAVAISNMCAHLSDWVHERQPLSVGELQDRYSAMALRLAGAPRP